MSGFTQSLLSNLPQELRLVIYEACFEDFKNAEEMWYSKYGLRSKYRLLYALSRPRRVFRAKCLISILSVCRTVHGEATPTFWQFFGHACRGLRNSRFPWKQLPVHSTRHMRSIACNLTQYAPELAGQIEFTFHVNAEWQPTVFHERRVWTVKAKQEARKALQVVYSNGLVKPWTILPSPERITLVPWQEYFQIENYGVKFRLSKQKILLEGYLAKLDWHTTGVHINRFKQALERSERIGRFCLCFWLYFLHW